jgi:hypothetical protein
LRTLRYDPRLLISTRTRKSSPRDTAATFEAPSSEPTRVGSAKAGWIAFLAGVALVSGAFALLLLPGATVDDLVKEDGAVEWAGAIGLFAGSALFLASFIVARRRGPEASQLTRLGVWVLLLMAGGLFFAGGEEISWGQRLFGYGEPSSLGEFNAQHELNLHNINIFQGGAIDGDRLFRMAYIGLFVLLPALTWVSARARRRLDGLVPIMPPWLAGLFLAAWVIAEIARHAIDGTYSPEATYPLTHSVSEVLESSVEIMAGIAGYLSLRRVLQRQAATPDR